MVSPILAAVASFFIPGLGQYLGGQGVQKAIIFFVLLLVITAVLMFVGFPYLGIIYNIYAAYDAYTNAE